MRHTIRIGNGAGFWGDNLDAPVRLVEKGRLDYLTLEYLAELTLSILAHQRKENPRYGYVGDFPALMQRLAPLLREQPGLRIVTNAGGLNPMGCARETARALCAAGLGSEKIAWVSGDDLMTQVTQLTAEGEAFRHFDSGAALPDLNALVSANAYLGAMPIRDALGLGARIVITGRVADASLTVGPALHEFGWEDKDWDRMAAASTAGHLIECGAQVTGGLLTRWKSVPGYADIGYPIAELSADGGVIITKAAGTGGVVNRETVTEQLLYEIGDPSQYITPDVTLDFTQVEVEETGKDSVRVKGARGKPPPETLKVSCSYANGFTARGELVVCGSGAVEKARACGEMMLARVAAAGAAPKRHNIEILGAGACLPGVSVPERDLKEVVLRVSVWDPDKKNVERFCREITPVITSGPPGVTGYAGSRPKASQVFAYWPTRVKRGNVGHAVEVHQATEMAA
jgi:hypothetical protein